MSAPTIDCGSPPGGTVGTPYSHAMPNTHTGAFTVAVTAGALPPGLTMSTSGVITGTPTAAGSFAYTTTITDTGGTGGAGGTIPSHPGDIAQDHLGPDLGTASMGQFAFTVGDAAYAFITNPGSVTGSCKIAVHKSTDLGQTWTEVGASSSPVIIEPGSASPVWSVAQDGSDVIAVWAEMHEGTPWTVAHIGKAVFSFTTESWGAGASIANPGLDMAQRRVFDSSASEGESFTMLQLITRGPGNYILFYQGTCNVLSATPPAVARQARASYSTFNGSTFGPEVQLPGQTATYFYFIYGGCADASGLVTLLYTRKEWPDATSGTNVVMSCSLTAANALGSPVDITSAAFDGSMFRRAISTPVAYTTGGTAHVAFSVWTSEGGSNTGVRVFDAVSVASPSWTNSLVTNDQAVQPVFPSHSFVYPHLISAMGDGSKLVVVWAQSTFVDDLQAAFYYSSTPVGGTFAWTAPAVLWVPPILDGSPSEASQVNVFLTTGGFGVVGVSTATNYDPGSQSVQSSFIPSGGGTGGTDSVNCAITIHPSSSLGLGCASPPGGVVGSPYIHTFPVSGGTPPYTFAITSGILPPGLTLDSLAGQVSGTPTLAGDYEFVIQVSDNFGSTVGTCDIVITVTDEPASGIGCGSPPSGTVGASYSHTFPVTDIPSGATVVYSITGGALPAGLTLNTSTGQVTGTPTVPGHYSFTITATIT